MSTRVLVVGGALAIGLLPGCGSSEGTDKGKEPAPTRRRVDAVAAKAAPKTDIEGFCDRRPTGDDALTFVMPPLATKPDAVDDKRWRWVNVWATWCKPCVEELPMLAGWQDKLSDARVPLDIVYLSVDETQDVVDAFRTEHPKAPESARLASADALGPWLTSLGLGESTALPIHLFVDEGGQVQCIRLGQVNERDYDNVVALVRGG